MTRRRYRPPSPRPLETRQLMSHAGVTHHAPAPAVVHAESAHSKPLPTGVGVLGDSLGDEYQFYTPDRSRARNYVEILAATRKLDFGPFTRSSRGEPRNQGFAYDWARSDSTTSDMVANQVPGLVKQIKSGQVGTVSILSGDNDFLDFAQQAVANPLTDANVVFVESTAATNLDHAIGSILAASPNVRVVVATIPDFTVTPAARALVATVPGGPALLGALSEAIGAYNNHVVYDAATNGRVALADVNAGTSTLLASGATSIPFDGTTIDLATSGGHYQDFFVGDGFHPGTIGQGLIADVVVSGLDARFSAGIPILTDTQIVKYAKSVPGALKT